MNSIIRWIQGFGILTAIFGIVGLVNWLVNEESSLDAGIGPLTRIIIGAALVVIGIGFYRVDRAIYKKRCDDEFDSRT